MYVHTRKMITVEMPSDGDIILRNDKDDMGDLLIMEQDRNRIFISYEAVKCLTRVMNKAVRDTH